MSKIVLSFISPVMGGKLLCYYDQFASSLKQNHDVFCFNVFRNFYKENLNKAISDKIIEIKPDLIICFNHVIDEKVYRNTDCPVLIIEADSFQSFANKTLIKKYLERIYLGVGHENRIKLYCDFLPFMKKDRIFTFPPATNLKNEKCKQDINISIISTVIGLNTYDPVVSLIMSNRFNKNKLSQIKALIEKCKKNINQLSEGNKFDIKYDDMSQYISYQNRAYLLDQLADLGLTVFGQYYNEGAIFESLHSLSFCLSDQDVFSAKENQDVYNRSKLSVNLHFAQNTNEKSISSYSWRVPDIMSTNACLVSTNCEAIRQDFGKWVNIPMFNTRYEARELCQKLLAEDNWRKDIIAASNLAIKEGKFTFDERVKNIEEIFNLKINETKKCEGLYFYTNTQRIKVFALSKFYKKYIESSALFKFYKGFTFVGVIKKIFSAIYVRLYSKTLLSRKL